MPAYILIIFIGFAGFLLSHYIAHKKRRKDEHFVCPLRASCTEVVHSDYSRFLGIHVEHIGMLYYGLIAIGYGLLASLSGIAMFSLILFSISTLAFLFSVYLTFVQIFILRKLCTWCLISAFMCLMIFLISFNSVF